MLVFVLIFNAFCNAYTHTFITYFVIVFIEITSYLTSEFSQVLCILLTPLQHVFFISGLPILTLFLMHFKHISYAILSPSNSTHIYYYSKLGDPSCKYIVIVGICDYITSTKRVQMNPVGLHK